MANLEPIEEKDLELEKKFSAAETGRRIEAEPAALEKETAREASPAETESTYGRILSQVQSEPAIQYSSEDIKTDAQAVYQKTDAESQVQHLVDIAFAKGVTHAVKVARHLEDNYVLDMFHDRMLADDLHQALAQRGLIKEG